MSAPDTSANFFEAMFRDSNDPWNFASDAYEQARYETVLKALGTRRYRYAFEPGCSVGALTEKLAGVCDRVDATDFSNGAAERARKRCGSLPGVTVRCEPFTTAQSFRDYDLVVLSEIGYYFSAATWESIVEGIAETMQPGAVLVASHWLGSSPDHVIGGDEVHSLMQRLPLHHELSERHPDVRRGGFRLDRWSKL